MSPLENACAATEWRLNVDALTQVCADGLEGPHLETPKKLAEVLVLAWGIGAAAKSAPSPYAALDAIQRRSWLGYESPSAFGDLMRSELGAEGDGLVAFARELQASRRGHCFLPIVAAIEKHRADPWQFRIASTAAAQIAEACSQSPHGALIRTLLNDCEEPLPVQGMIMLAAAVSWNGVRAEAGHDAILQNMRGRLRVWGSRLFKQYRPASPSEMAAGTGPLGDGRLLEAAQSLHAHAAYLTPRALHIVETWLA